jgi:hypothetical protein
LLLTRAALLASVLLPPMASHAAEPTSAPISGLPTATSTTGGELLPCVQGGVTRRCTVQQIVKAPMDGIAAEVGRALGVEASKADNPRLDAETIRALTAEAAKQDANGDVSGARVTIHGGNSPRTIAEWAKDSPTPADFLGSGQTTQQLLAGQIDATAMMAALANTGGGHIPCGTYRINSGFVVHNGLVGAGSDCVTLQSYVVNGDVINVPAGATNLKISGIHVISMVSQTGGAAIHIQGGNTIHLDDITTVGSPQPFNVIYQIDQGTNTTFLSNFVFTNAIGPCIQLSGVGTPALVIETHISHGVMTSCSDGFLANSGSGVYLDDVDALGNRGIGIRFAVNADSYFFGASIHNSYADSNAGGGLSFECGAAGCGPINQVTATNLWASGSGVVNPFTAPVITYPSSGIHVVNPKTDGVTIVGGQVRANAGHGVYFEAGRNLALSGVLVLQNAFLNNTFCGIYLGISANRIVLNGNIIGPGGVDATPLQGNRANQMASPLCRPTPTTTDPNVEISVMGNIMDGNLQGPLVGSRPGDAIIGPPVNGVSLNIGW